MVFCLLALAALGSAGFAFAATFAVNLKSTGPQPSTLSVAWGDTVTLANADTVPLGVTSKYPDLNNPALQPGATVTKVFNGKAGSYGYKVVTPKNESRGAIVVTLSGKVTMTAKPIQIIYGQRVSFVGKSTILGAPVVLEGRAAKQSGSGGKTSWLNLATIPTSEDGSYATQTRPAKGASYRVTTAADQLASNIVTIRVKPALTIHVAPRSVRAGATILVRAKVRPVDAATQILLTQSTGGTSGKWHIAGSGKVSRLGVAVIRWSAPAGRSLIRVEVRKTNLAKGYVEQASRSVSVTASNAPTTLHVTAESGKKFKFTPKKLKAKSGRITLVLANLSSVRHGIALRGNGASVVGRVVGKGGFSSVTALLKPGTYVFYDPVPGNAQKGMQGTLVVSG